MEIQVVRRSHGQNKRLVPVYLNNDATSAHSQEVQLPARRRKDEAEQVQGS